MNIFWQSFVDASINAPYMKRLSDYLNSIAAPGVKVHVEGISPPDRDFGRLAEMRCAIAAIDNGIAAEQAGYDAYVMGHFQDPGLYELRSALRIPVIGAGEATLLAASQLGRRLRGTFIRLGEQVPVGEEGMHRSRCRAFERTWADRSTDDDGARGIRHEVKRAAEVRWRVLHVEDGGAPSVVSRQSHRGCPASAFSRRAAIATTWDRAGEVPPAYSTRAALA